MIRMAMFDKQKIMGTFVLLSLLALSGCETVNSGFGGVLNLDTNVTLNLVIDSDINPDERNTPSPLYLRFYQLKDKKMFERADFVQLYEQDQEAIGADLISGQKLKLIQPGQSRSEKFVLDGDAKFIGLYAEFFKYKDAKYKIVIPVTSANVIRDTVKVKISENQLILLEK